MSSASRAATSPPGSSSGALLISSRADLVPSGSGPSPRLTRYSGTPVVSQALAASACMPSNPISRLAAESVRWYSSSGATSSGFSGSTTSPALSAPKYPMRKCGMFGSCMATTWPGPRPASRSPAANRPDSSSSSRYVVVVPAKRQAGASGAARVASVRMVARLKLIPPQSPAGQFR